MKAIEREAPITEQPTKILTKVALLAGALVVVGWATVLTVEGRYVDVEQFPEIPLEGPSAVVHGVQPTAEKTQIPPTSTANQTSPRVAQR